MININEYFSQNEKPSLISEYLLSKNKKTNASLDPMDVFIKLCGNKKNVYNHQHILSIIDSLEYYLKNEKFNTHVDALLDIIEKAIDNGYIMNYASAIKGYYTNPDGSTEHYFNHQKTIIVGNPVNTSIFVDFLNLELPKPILCAVTLSDIEFEMAIAEANNYHLMVTNMHNGLLSWDIDYNSELTNDVEKFKKTINKRLGL